MTAAIASTLTYNRPTMRLNASYTLGWYKSEFEGLGGYNDESFFIMQPSTGDERHRVVLSGLGDLPYGLKLSGDCRRQHFVEYVAGEGADRLLQRLCKSVRAHTSTSGEPFR